MPRCLDPVLLATRPDLMAGRLLTCLVAAAAVIAEANGGTPHFQPEYVIVGAGAAGCALAARLAFAGKYVILLEEGPDHNFLGTTELGTPMDPYDFGNQPLQLSVSQYQNVACDFICVVAPCTASCPCLCTSPYMPMRCLHKTGLQ
eukprot:778327-Pleurochrysis_carterae.AAC.2